MWELRFDQSKCPTFYRREEINGVLHCAFIDYEQLKDIHCSEWYDFLDKRWSEFIAKT